MGNTTNRFIPLNKIECFRCRYREYVALCDAYAAGPESFGEYWEDMTEALTPHKDFAEFVISLRGDRYAPCPDHPSQPAGTTTGL